MHTTCAERRKWAGIRRGSAGMCPAPDGFPKAALAAGYMLADASTAWPLLDTSSGEKLISRGSDGVRLSGSDSIVCRLSTFA
jgi:hypothetical protein